MPTLMKLAPSSPATARAINYAELVNDPELMSAIWHTAFYTALFVPTSVILGLLIALALNRKIRFIGVYRTAIFVPFVASAAATGILANYIFDPQFRLRQQHPAIHRSARAELPRGPAAGDDRHRGQVAVGWARIHCRRVSQPLQDIPKDLVEAARVDGANTWQTFRHVILPELTPVTVFTSFASGSPASRGRCPAT